jgi:hypothetical protein
MTGRERLLDELRPAAFAVAYRMLGTEDGETSSCSCRVGPCSRSGPLLAALVFSSGRSGAATRPARCGAKCAPTRAKAHAIDQQL